MRITELKQQFQEKNAIGRYEQIVNSHPGRSWGQRVGCESAKSIAVVVGISNYSGGYPTLSTARADAEKNDPISY
jgi:hypothetical protein